MPELFLHIGTEKTGSTAIQRFLSKHSSSLAQAGLHVPQCLGHPEHWRFPLLFYADDQNDDLTERAGLQQLSLSQRHDALRELRQSLDLELASASAPAWVISSEHIHSRLLHRSAGMEALVSFLKVRFSRVNVIIYLREPLDAALSLWSTAVRNGASLVDLPLPKPGYWQHLCDHRSTVQRLEHWFPGQFSLRLYIPSEWPDRDVVGDFIDALALPRSLLQRTVPSRANRSLSWLSLRLLARLNRRSPKPPHELVVAIRDAFDHYPPPRASRDQELAYSSAYQESNNWVCAHYFPNRRELFPMASPYRIGST